jgi:hypothetical protein
MLKTSDDEDEDEEHADNTASGSSSSFKYLCRTPLPVSDADLDEDTAELTRRHIKRLKRRDGQRLAARAAMTFVASLPHLCLWAGAPSPPELDRCRSWIHLFSLMMTLGMDARSSATLVAGDRRKDVRSDKSGNFEKTDRGPVEVTGW